MPIALARGARRRYALESTQNPQAFAGAMTRLANQNLAAPTRTVGGLFCCKIASANRQRLAMAANWKPPAAHRKRMKRSRLPGCLIC